MEAKVLEVSVQPSTSWADVEGVIHLPETISRKKELDEMCTGRGMSPEDLDLLKGVHGCNYKYI